jgi:hypothetical protein
MFDGRTPPDVVRLAAPVSFVVNENWTESSFSLRGSNTSLRLAILERDDGAEMTRRAIAHITGLTESNGHDPASDVADLRTRWHGKDDIS